jgi:hypothetical protein
VHDPSSGFVLISALATMTMTPRENDDALENEEEVAEILREEDVQEEEKEEIPIVVETMAVPKKQKKAAKEPEDRLIVRIFYAKYT